MLPNAVIHWNTKHLDSRVFFYNEVIRHPRLHGVKLLRYRFFSIPIGIEKTKFVSSYRSDRVEKSSFPMILTRASAWY